ncbi:hypothetical protein D3C72_194440 [compost metagenome]
MHEIQSSVATKGLYKIRKLPTLGQLSQNGTLLQVGSRFTQADINAGRILYHSTVPLDPGVDQIEDSFEFSMWQEGLGDITGDMYSDCMPPREIPTPANGIFVFPITIKRPVDPIAGQWPDTIVLREEGSLVITSNLLSVTDPNFAPDEIIYTLTSKLANGYLSLRGRNAVAFTQADVNAGDVVYFNTRLGNGSERLEFNACTIESRCTETSLDLVITPKFRQIGDNVIYAEVGTTFHWSFTSNVPNALWELKSGTEVPPQNTPPSAGYIVDWSTYATNSDLPSDSPDRGPGFDKLPSYRNIKERLFWDGGLPLGVTLSSVGYIATADRKPSSLAGTQPWKLPLKTGRYPFTVVAFDPMTNETHVRRYILVLTSNGLSNDGLASESIDL